MTIAMAATFQQNTTATQATIVFYAASNCQQMFKSKKLSQQTGENEEENFQRKKQPGIKMQIK